MLSKWWSPWIDNSCKITGMENVSDVPFRRDVEFVEEVELLQDSERFTFFIVQSSHWLIADKVLNINYDFILNCKVFYMTLIICLLNHITLSFCEVVMSNQEYSIYDSSNFCGRMNLKLLLCCGGLCDIRIKEHVRAETFVEIKWCHFDRFVNSIVISEFNY